MLKLQPRRPIVLALLVLASHLELQPLPPLLLALLAVLAPLPLPVPALAALHPVLRRQVSDSYRDCGWPRVFRKSSTDASTGPAPALAIPLAVPLAVPLTLGEAAGPAHAPDSGAAAGPVSSSGEPADPGLVPALPAAPNSKPAKFAAAAGWTAGPGLASAARSEDYVVYFTSANWRKGAGKYHKVASCAWLHKHRQSMVGNNTEAHAIRNGMGRCAICWP